MPRTRPGFKLVTTVENGQEVSLWVRDDEPTEPDQATLDAELEGAVNLGWRTETVPSQGRRPAQVRRYELFTHLDRWGIAWRRYDDGTIVRLLSTDKQDPKPEPLGVVSKRWSDGPSMFPAAPEPKPAPPAPNPFDELDPATLAAVRALIGGR